MSKETEKLKEKLLNIIEEDRYYYTTSTEEILENLLDTMKDFRGDVVLEVITGE